MARARQAMAHRGITRLLDAGERMAHEIAQYIVEEIVADPKTPYDNSPQRREHNQGPHLKFSYYTKRDPDTGHWLVMTRRRYWAFVEFGTREHGGPQPHVRPAIELAKAKYR